MIPVLSTNRFSGPAARRPDIWTVMDFWRRLRVEKSGTGQSSPAIVRMLPTIPVVCFSGRPNSTFTIKQKLDRRIRENSRATVATGPGCQPHHVLVQPDQQRAALLQRVVVGFQFVVR
ncbi:hypothetical protein RA26_15770 [Leisingera sp. ANG-M7]|nr:hypothetical protein RA26_15770 [Leisingera sp. ANG-M7]